MAGRQEEPKYDPQDSGDFYLLTDSDAEHPLEDYGPGDQDYFSDLAADRYERELDDRWP